MYEMLETLRVTLIRVEIQELHAVRYNCDINKSGDTRATRGTLHKQASYIALLIKL